MVGDLVDCVEQVLDIAVGHAWKNREGENPLVCRLGARTQTGRVSEFLAVERMQIDGKVMDIDPDALGAAWDTAFASDRPVNGPATNPLIFNVVFGVGF